MRLMRKIGLASMLVSVMAASAAAQTPAQKVTLTAIEPLRALAWQSLASDPSGDGLHPRLPDAKALSYAIDPATQFVWFKVDVYEPLPERFFGINIAFNTDEDPQSSTGMAWWGTNKIKFHRLASAYLFDAGSYWQGVAGLSDAEGAGKMNMNNLSRDVKVALDRDHRAILVGVPRASLGTAPTVRVIATVGSMMVNNDDIPNEGMVVVKLKP